MKPDIILTWPAFCDFPKWRAQMNEYRDEFGRIIAVVSRNVAAGVDHTEWLRENAPHIEFHDLSSCGGEWRSNAVNTGLAISDSDRVLFTEPDFFFDRGCYRLIEQAIREPGDAAAVRCVTGRWHPCFILALREDIEHTTRDFDSGDDGDHFARFSRELNKAVKPTQVADVSGEWYTHMQGLAEAHHLIDQGEPVRFQVEKFAAYLHECLDLGVALPDAWELTTRAWLATHATG